MHIREYGEYGEGIDVWGERGYSRVWTNLYLLWYSEKPNFSIGEKIDLDMKTGLRSL